MLFKHIGDKNLAVQNFLPLMCIGSFNEGKIYLRSRRSPAKFLPDFLDNLSYDPISSPAAISGLCISCFAGDFCLAGVLGSEIAAGEDLG